MMWDDHSYYKAYDHNYRVAYEAGEPHLGAGSTHRKAFRKLQSLLNDSGFPVTGTALLDVGCGDGTNSIFLSGLGYNYHGIDVSPAAIDKARQRIRDANLVADIRQGDAMVLSDLPDRKFQIVLDSYCFHLLVIDTHRALYLENIRNVLSNDGCFIILAARDDAAYDGPIPSFDAFCRATGTTTEGVPLQTCIDGTWTDDVERRVFLMGRPQSMDAYRREFLTAGFNIRKSDSWEDGRKVAFLLNKR